MQHFPGNRAFVTTGASPILPGSNCQEPWVCPIDRYAPGPDPTAGRVYYLGRDNFSSSGPLTLKAFDMNTFVLIGSATLSGITGDPTTLVRWGTNGLAFHTTAGQLFLLQTSIIPSSDPIPTPTPTPTATPTPTPVPVPTFIR